MVDTVLGLFGFDAADCVFELLPCFLIALPQGVGGIDNELEAGVRSGTNLTRFRGLV